MQRSLEWVQPHMLKEMTFDLMAGEERVATYRPRNAWKQSAIIESDGTRLTITPNTFQTEWTVTEGDDLEVTTVRGLFKRKGRFTTVEGETYTWKRPGLLSGRRIFCKADGTEIMHIDQTLGFSCTRANIMMLPADIPERDRVLLAGLAMHMVTIEQMMIVLFAALMPLFLTAAS